MLAACMPKSRAQKSEHLTSAHNGADSPEVRTHQRVRFDPFSNCVNSAHGYVCIGTAHCLLQVPETKELHHFLWTQIFGFKDDHGSSERLAQ